MSKFYVTMTDKFMSGWGLAEDRINKLVLECDSPEEAERVKKYAQSRGEMKHVSIATKKPNYPMGKYYTQYLTKEDYPTWYKK